METRTAVDAKSVSQTLDRGIQILEILADGDGPATVTELAARTGIDRSVIYRLVRTLAAHRLVARESDGRIRLGTGLIALSGRLAGDLQTAAGPELASLANDLGATAFLTIEDSGDAVCLAAAEPRDSHVHVAYRPGLRHPIDQGASAVALLAGRPPTPNERPAITRARADGYAISEGEVQAGTLAVAAPIRPGRGDVIASVAIVSLVGALDPANAVPRVVAAATTIAEALGGPRA